MGALHKCKFEPPARGRVVCRLLAMGLLSIGLVTSAASKLGATPPAVEVPSRFHADASHLYVTWGGLQPSSGTGPDRPVLSAIEIATGQIAWSIRGEGLLVASDHLRSRRDSSLPVVGNLTFLSGFIGTKQGSFAIDLAQHGYVRWSSSERFAWTGQEIVITRSGRVLDAASGRLLWAGADCSAFAEREASASSDANSDSDSGAELICFREKPRRLTTPLEKARASVRTKEWSIARLVLRSGRVLDEIDLGRSQVSRILGVDGELILLEIWRHAAREVWFLDLSTGERWTAACQGHPIHVPARHRFFCPIPAKGSDEGKQIWISIDLAQRVTTELGEISVPFEEPPAISDAGALLGWSEEIRRPVEVLDATVRPLLSAGSLQTPRRAWIGSRGRTFVLTAKGDLTCLAGGETLWQTHSLHPLHILDTGAHGLLVFQDGVIVSFDPTTGQFGPRTYSWDSIATATHWNDRAQIERLLARGVEPEAPSRHNSTSPLQVAIGAGNAPLVDFLLDRIPVDEPEEIHWTLLHVAAAMGRADLVELLLAAGADPLRLDRWGRRPSAVAADRKHPDVAQILERSEAAKRR